MSLRKVLIVDDQGIVRQLAAKMLTSLGFLVEQAENGRAALRKLKSDKFQLMLTDTEMPMMDGFQLLSRVKEIPTLTNLSVVVCATQGRQEHIALAKKLGAAACIVKPVEQPKLLEVLNQLGFIEG